MNKPAGPKTAKSDIRLSTAQSGELALAVLDSLPDGVYVVDGDDRITFANQGFVSHMGLSLQALVGRPIWDVLVEKHQDRLREAFMRVRQTGLVEGFIQESVLYPGRSVDISVVPVLDGLTVMVRDVTRRAAAERALAVSETHLRLALHGASMGDWAWNAETDIMTMSAQTIALYGLAPGDLTMKRDELRRVLIHPDDVPAVREAAERAHREQSQYDVEYRIRRDGEWRWMRVMGGPHLIDGRAVGMHGLVQDIDDRKRASVRLQAEIEEREKSQQRQQLLIHELNHRVKNILAMVQAMAAQTLSSATSLEGARGALENRLIALAQAHDVLTRESWDGAELLDIVQGAVALTRPGRARASASADRGSGWSPRRRCRWPWRCMNWPPTP